MNLATLDTSTLTEFEQMHLAPFHLAYTRPYPPAVTWRELRSEGFMPIEHETCGLEGILEGMDEWDLSLTFHVDADGNARGGDVDRPDWQTRRIHQWQRAHLK